MHLENLTMAFCSIFFFTIVATSDSAPLRGFNENEPRTAIGRRVPTDEKVGTLALITDAI